MHMSVDAEVIRHALAVARQKGFAEVDIETDAGYFSATLEKSKRPAVQAAQPMAAPQDKAASNGMLDIKAPLVGYYRQGKSTLEPGKSVNKGDVVAVIAALGLANDVESPHSGEIAEVLVKDGDPVQYGQILARVKVSS